MKLTYGWELGAVGPGAYEVLDYHQKGDEWFLEREFIEISASRTFIFIGSRNQIKNLLLRNSTAKFKSAGQQLFMSIGSAHKTKSPGAVIAEGFGEKLGGVVMPSDPTVMTFSLEQSAKSISESPVACQFQKVMVRLNCTKPPYDSNALGDSISFGKLATEIVGVPHFSR